MIYIRPECYDCRNGINIYPWRDRATSLGFIVKIGPWRWMVRLARHVGLFYNKIYRA
jgi:hypothetical protein